MTLAVIENFSYDLTIGVDALRQTPVVLYVESITLTLNWGLTAAFVTTADTCEPVVADVDVEIPPIAEVFFPVETKVELPEANCLIEVAPLLDRIDTRTNPRSESAQTDIQPPLEMKYENRPRNAEGVIVEESDLPCPVGHQERGQQTLCGRFSRSKCVNCHNFATAAEAGRSAGFDNGAEADSAKFLESAQRVLGGSFGSGNCNRTGFQTQEKIFRR